MDDSGGVITLEDDGLGKVVSLSPSLKFPPVVSLPNPLRGVVQDLLRST